MTGLFVGPVPPRDFLLDFLKLKSLQKPKARLKVDFSQVPSVGVERDTYEPICNAINNSDVCPGFRLIDISSSMDDNNVRLRPDLVLVPTDAEDLMDYTITEFFVEAKFSDFMDPFYDVQDTALDDTEEKPTVDNADALEQITSYAATLLARQHRTFAFSIAIYGQYVRFFRWDRAGCIVSDKFSFLEDSDLLADFLWCYAHMTREQRGFDPTVVPASAAESKLLSDALSRYIEESKPRDVSYLQPKPDSTYPISKMQIPMTKGVRDLIVGKPFWDADSPDRTTSAYAAYDMVDKKIVFAKDSWRDEDEGMLSEAEIYDILKKNNVPFLPEVIAAGNVYVKTKKKKVYQRTLIEKWYTSNSRSLLWCLPSTDLRTLVHCRVVQELAYPLTSALSSKEAVQAIRDAIEAIKVAYHDAKIFHRDISTGNIMISKSGRGILNDWDHALKVILRDTPQGYRGTWQFISVPLLRRPKKGHEVHDDLESSFWVLLYISLHYFKHTKLFDVDFFNEYNEYSRKDSSTRHAYGGLAKKDFLSGTLRDVKWTCAPLTKLLHKFGDLFDQYQFYYGRRDREEHAASFTDIQNQLDQVDSVLDLFDTALASDEWPENDVLPDQYSRNDEKKETEEHHHLKSQAVAPARERNPVPVAGIASPVSIPNRSAISAARSSTPLVQHSKEEQPPVLEAGPLQLPVGSCSTGKRTIDEVPAEVSVSKRAKTAARRPLKRAPRPPPPERPVVEHRYPTRFKLNASRQAGALSNHADIEMQDTRRRNPSRSSAKSKLHETRRQQVAPSIQKPTKEKKQTGRKVKKPTKSTEAGGSRSQARTSTRRRRG
ncbi:unnamed protein product [Somion occarium]|uniref:Fungal-type protein kinase domain-containing protein n=1 Tax=Somion occarium TaxID=3059160 RepID=A0ABP1DX84_9APHY